MLNSISISGRLAKDPELRTTQSGKSVCSFSVAVERDFAPQGQQREVDWFEVVAWEKTGEFVSKWFHKGDMITVTGRMQARDWTDQSGQKRRSWEIQASSCYFCGKNESSHGGQSYGQNQYGGYGPQGGYQNNGGYPPQNGYQTPPPQNYGAPPQYQGGYQTPPQGQYQPQNQYQAPALSQQQGFTDLGDDESDLPFD